MDARGTARFLFFLRTFFFRSFYTGLPPPCPLRAHHYGHPESTDTAEYKAKGEAERESQKRGNRRQVIRKLVSVVQARTFASQDGHSGKGYARMGQPSRGTLRLRKGVKMGMRVLRIERY